MPDKTGGTEIYVQRLTSELLKQNHEVIILIPSKKDSYYYNSLKIEIFDPENDCNFISRIKNINPQIVHFHSLDADINYKHIKIVKKLNYKVFFTPHLNNTFCLRNGSFKYKGKRDCNKVINTSKCYNCLHAEKKHTIKKWIIRTLLFLRLSNILPKYYKRFTSVNKTIAALKTINVIALNPFQEKILKINKVHSRIISHGIDFIKKSHKTHTETNTNNSKIKICYIGRISHEKGLHKLIDIYPRINDIAEIIVFGSTNLKDEYFISISKELKLLNIPFTINCPFTELVNDIANMDVICIPSLIYETGPMVALEALSLKIPILTSKYASNYTIENVNGLIFDPEIEEELYNKIKLLSSDRKMLLKLKNNITQPKSIAKVAKEHIDAYRKC